MTKEDKPKTQSKAKAKVSSRQLTERQLGAAAGRAERARIEAIKGKVYKFEETNRNRIVLWRTTDKWWKMGGNSALIYKERVAKRFKNTREPRLVNDTDFFSKFKTGVISIRDIDALEKRLKSLKIYPTVWQKDYVSFDLGYSLTEAELAAIKDLDKNRRAQINQIIAPKVIYPDVYAKLKVIRMDLYFLVTHIDQMGRDLVGEPAIIEMRQVMEIYYDMTNGEIEEREGLDVMYKGVCRLIYRMGEMLELGMVESKRALRIGQHLAAVKVLINSKKEKLENE